MLSFNEYLVLTQPLYEAADPSWTGDYTQALTKLQKLPGTKPIEAYNRLIASIDNTIQLYLSNPEGAIQLMDMGGTSKVKSIIGNLGANFYQALEDTQKKIAQKLIDLRGKMDLGDAPDLPHKIREVMGRAFKEDAKKWMDAIRADFYQKNQTIIPHKLGLDHAMTMMSGLQDAIITNLIDHIQALSKRHTVANKLKQHLYSQRTQRDLLGRAFKEMEGGLYGEKAKKTIDGLAELAMRPSATMLGDAAALVLRNSPFRPPFPEKLAKELQAVLF